MVPVVGVSTVETSSVLEGVGLGMNIAVGGSLGEKYH